MDKVELSRKAQTLLDLHEGPDPLVLVNAPDGASARIVVSEGFPAVATSSASIAWILGYPDGEAVTRDEVLFMVRHIAAAVDVPVTADMEAGYGPRPEDVAETVRLALEAGAVGMNLEDGIHGATPPLRDFSESVERVRAARKAADALDIPFVINARTDGFLLGGKGPEALAEAIRRGNAYREAGADCVFVPGVFERETIATLCREIAAPLNILARVNQLPIPELRELGVSRLSIGGLPSLAAYTVVRRLAQELRETGTYGFARDIILHPEMNRLMR